MTKEQVLAVKAMMYAYRNYSEKRLCHGEYTINPFTKDEVSIGFNKAYIICQEMVDVEGEEMDCRDCKKFEVCPCSKVGHENGTSQGYSIGECKDFEPKESEAEE